MDEPFSALDGMLRGRLRAQLKKILRSISMTTLMVTHSHREAFEFADRMTVWDHSLHYQSGRIQDILLRPQRPAFVEFMNAGILLEGSYSSASRTLVTCRENFPVANPGELVDEAQSLGFIPFGNLQLAGGKQSLGKARVVSRFFWGEKTVYNLEGEEGLRPHLFEMIVSTPERPLEEGQDVELFLREKKPLYIFQETQKGVG